ncbi:hypothetical protein [Actinomadura atramentaria]|uniref:hypothetical protein n=1 Tax=Actinomadura atramentaria TaxID=1990 RepID=UPI00036AAC72|nr:hypothetical protein [Actinomadura atramentaria]
MNRRQRAVASVSAAALLCAAPVALATPAHAASLAVSQRTGVPQSGATLTVTGSGFDAKRNNAFGVYVVFGPRPANFFKDANLFASAVWVHPGGGGNGQAPMSAAGSFSVRIAVKAKYTDGNGKAVNCLVSACYVMTMAAHGVPDRSQDAMVPIAFKGAARAPEANTPSGSGAGASPGSSASGSLGSTTPGGTAPPAAGTPTAAAGVPQGFATPVAAETFRQTAAGPPARSPAPFWIAVAAVAAAGIGVRLLARRRRRPAR